MKKKNFVLSLISACIPGFGQMYQGFMRRGFSLLFWFCLNMFLIIMLRLDALAVFLLVIWAVGFFDAFNLRNMPDHQRAALQDRFIPDQEFLHQYKLDVLIQSKNRNKIFGWILIGIGVVTLYGTIYQYFYWQVYRFFPFLADLMNAVMPLAIGCAVIVLGVKMLRGPKQAPPEEPIILQDDDEEIRL